MVVVADEPADLDAVVSEDAVAAPDLGAAHTVHEAAVPAVAALQRGDAALRTCAPFDELAEPAGLRHRMVQMGARHSTRDAHKRAASPRLRDGHVHTERHANV